MANEKEILREMMPKGSLVTLNYDDCEPEPITGHKITKLNGPQVQLSSGWYYLYQLRGGRETLARWREKTCTMEIQCSACKTQLTATQDGLMPKHKLPVSYKEPGGWRKRRRVFCPASGGTILAKERKIDRT